MLPQNGHWFDTEFIDNGRTVEMLSIGIVNIRGETYYAEPEETDRNLAGDWVKANVIPLMRGPIKPRAVIRDEIVEFVGYKPEFWAYFGAYDWVCMCQLFGTMLDVPNHTHGWPMFARDIQQLRQDRGIKFLWPQTTVKHHALNDAIWTKNCHEFILRETT